MGEGVVSQAALGMDPQTQPQDKLTFPASLKPTEGIWTDSDYSCKPSWSQSAIASHDSLRWNYYRELKTRKTWLRESGDTLLQCLGERRPQAES
jgi:hypothetical protein